MWDFPGSPVVKNLPANAGDTGLVPGPGTKILHAEEQLSPCAATTEARMPESLCAAGESIAMRSPLIAIRE